MRRTILALAAAIGMTTPALAKPDLDGTWILLRGDEFAKPNLTEVGVAAKESYDFRSSDPSLRCIPASWTRVYSNPNTPIEFSLTDDQLTVRYELFDIVREVEIVDAPGLPSGALSTKFAELGSSIGWYDGDALVVYSNHYGEETRVLSTIRQWAGLHQSALMSTVERYTREGDLIILEITHFDPVIYREPLKVTYKLDLEREFVVEPYNCLPEDAEINTLDHLNEDR